LSWLGPVSKSPPSQHWPARVGVNEIARLVRMADYYSLINRAVAALEMNTFEDRRAIYNRARAVQSYQLGQRPFNKADFDRERSMLEDAISRVETEAMTKRIATEASVSPALEVSVAGAALEVSMCTADAHFLDAASVAVAAEAVGAAEAAGAAELAGYGHPPGAGSTPAGPNLHLRVKNLASPRSQSHRQHLRVKNLASRPTESHR
jgi:hypothetical protein